MKKWIRWKGLGAFIIITVILGVFWLILIDGIIKGIIEKSGTKIVGAKVELNQADLSLFPIGLKLKGLQVTNPDDPMVNAVEVAEMRMAMDTIKLFRRKMIIDGMSLEGVRLNTPRRSSGAILEKKVQTKEKPQRESSQKFISLPSFELPDVKEIMAREELESLKLIKALDADIESQKELWRKKLEDLPGKEDVAEYEHKIKGIRSKEKGISGILGTIKDVEKIQKDIKRDIEQIKAVEEEYKKGIELLKKRLSRIEKSPQEDIKRLKEKYALSYDHMGNFSQLLFGEKITQWLDTILAWYERVKPMLGREKTEKKAQKPPRGKGIDVHFKERTPLPNFLIRQANASINLEAGDLKGMIKNISSDPLLLNAPLTFSVSGEKMKGLKSMAMEGTFTQISPDKRQDQVSVQIREFQVRDMILSKSENLPITLKEGLVNLDMDAQMRDEEIFAQVNTQLQSTRLFMNAQDKTNQMAQNMGSILSDISGFHLNANISGTIDAIDLKITSDLDRILKDAFKKLLEDQGAKFQKRLETEILAKVEEPIRSSRDKMKGLLNIEKEFTNRSNMLSDTLKDTILKGESKGLKLPF